MAVPIPAKPPLTAVRNDLLRDTGNASMASRKYRDAARKPTGNIALTDFGNRVWTQGRTTKSSSLGDSLSAMKGHDWDMRTDNISPYSITREVNDNGGLPKWSCYWKGLRNVPTAVYNTGWAYVPSNTNVTLKVTANRWTGKNIYFSHCDISVYGWSSGFLSGSSLALIPANSSMNYTGNQTTFTFNTNSSYPYVQIVPRIYCGEWNGVMGYDTYAAFEMYDIELIKT